MSQMANGIVNGCTYAYNTSGKTIHVKVVRFDPITKRHVVTSNGRSEWQVDGKRLGRRVRQQKRKSDTSQIYLYMCNIGDTTYKVGVTCDPERRRKQINTYTPQATMKSIVKVAKTKGSQWASLEKKVLDRFATHRLSGGGKEVFRLDQTQAAACAGYMRAVCA